MINQQARAIHRAGKLLRNELQQVLIARDFIRFKIPIFQKVYRLCPAGNAGNRRIKLTNLPLVGEPLGIESGAINQRNNIVLVLRLVPPTT